MHLVDMTMFWSGQGGGVQRYLRAKSTYFSTHQGIRQTIVVPGPLIAHPPQVPGIPLPFSAGYRLPRNRSAVQKVLRSLRPDLIEAGDPYQMAWAALRAGEELGIPVAAFYHSNLPDLAARAFGEYGRKAAQSYVRRLYRRFDQVFAPSRHVVARLVDMGVEHVVQQPLGVDCERFSPVFRDLSWRRARGIDADARVLLYVGRYAAEKNLQVLIDAVTKLGAPYVLVMIGGGPITPAGARVLTLPFEADQDALALAYASADAFVHAGDQETFGLAILEALASGLPTVGCAAGGVAELVDDSVGAAVPCHADAFAEAIAGVFARDRERLATNARLRAQAYTWDTVLEGLSGHYHALCERPVAGPLAERRAA